MNLVKGTNHPKNYSFVNDEVYALRNDEVLRLFVLIRQYIEKKSRYQQINIHMAVAPIWNFSSNQSPIACETETWYGTNRRNRVIQHAIQIRVFFMKTVKMNEARKLAESTSARRALTVKEFRQVIGKTHLSGNGHTRKYILAVYYIFQFHMLARVDNVVHFQCDDLTLHLEFDFALKFKMC